jgi:hypothetical protein
MCPGVNTSELALKTILKNKHIITKFFVDKYEFCRILTVVTYPDKDNAWQISRVLTQPMQN